MSHPPAITTPAPSASAQPSSGRTRVAYLFTTFPVDSETFLQREIRAMRARDDLEIEIFSLWGGAAEWEGLPVRRFSLASVPRVLFFRLPLWCWRRPRALHDTVSEYLSASPRGGLDIAENLLGLAFALDTAEAFSRKPPRLFHGVWTTTPGAAARLLSRLTGVPYSLGAHAYDIFKHGGDWIAAAKLRDAAFVHNSTAAARARTLALGASPARARLIRRGLNEPLPIHTPRPPTAGRAVRLLSVGRLVPKKGFERQLLIYRALADAGVDFHATIVGDGPLRAELAARLDRLGLGGRVTLAGKLPYAAVSDLHAAADIFVFTGLIDADGDRDGLPNVLGEAMAHGAAVITTPVSGTTEAIHDQTTGQVVALDDLAGWVRAVRRVTHDPDFAARTRAAARAWVEENFRAGTNAARVADAFHRAADTPPRHFFSGTGTVI